MKWAINIKRSGSIVVECMSKIQMEKALKIFVLGAGIDIYPVACFPLSKKAPIEGVDDGVSRGVDARRFKECKGVTDS